MIKLKSSVVPSRRKTRYQTSRPYAGRALSGAAAHPPFALEYAFHLLGDVNGKTVLDLGCGTGSALFP